MEILYTNLLSIFFGYFPVPLLSISPGVNFIFTRAEIFLVDDYVSIDVFLPKTHRGEASYCRHIMSMKRIIYRNQFSISITQCLVNIHNSPINSWKWLEFERFTIVIFGESIYTFFAEFAKFHNLTFLVLLHLFHVGLLLYMFRMKWSISFSIMASTINRGSLRYVLLMSSFCFSSTSGGLSIVLKIDPSKSMFGIDLIRFGSSKWKGVQKDTNFPEATIPEASTENAQKKRRDILVRKCWASSRCLSRSTANTVLCFYFSRECCAHCTVHTNVSNLINKSNSLADSFATHSAERTLFWHFAVAKK